MEFCVLDNKHIRVNDSILLNRKVMSGKVFLKYDNLLIPLSGSHLESCSDHNLILAVRLNIVSTRLVKQTSIAIFFSFKKNELPQYPSAALRVFKSIKNDFVL